MQNYMTIIINAIKSWVNGKINILEKDLNSKVEEVSEQASNAIDAIAEIPQADWNQSDETAKDYVKNRTHYDDTKTFFNLEDYNGDYSSLESVETEGRTYYKVSEVDGIDLSGSFDVEFFVNNIEKNKVNNLKPNEFFTQELPALTYGVQREEYPYGTSVFLGIIRGMNRASTSLIIALEDGSSFNVEGTEVTLSKGIWVANIGRNPVFTSLTVNDIKQLDPKYIKDMYYEKTEEKLIFEDTFKDITETEYMYWPNSSGSLERHDAWKITLPERSYIVNDEYTIVFNGVSYKLTLNTKWDMYNGGLYFGFGFVEDGEPLGNPVTDGSAPFVGYFYDYVSQENQRSLSGMEHFGELRFYIPKTSEAFPETVIQIYHNETEIKQLESTFVKDMYYDNTKVLAECIVESPNVLYLLPELPNDFRINNSYVFEVNGIEYKELPSNGTSGDIGYYFYFGSEYSEDSWKDKIYPFSVLHRGTKIDNYIIFNDTATFPATFKLKEKNIKYVHPKYIKDMYHEEFKEIFNVKDAEFTDGQYGIQPVFVITEGKTYKVNWDGVEYVCEAYASNGGAIIGDMITAEGPAGDKPFAIGYMDGMDFNPVMALDGLTTHTFSVAEVVYNTIPPKYIKDMYYDNTKKIEINETCKIGSVLNSENCNKNLAEIIQRAADLSFITINISGSAINEVGAGPFYIGETYKDNSSGTIECRLVNALGENQEKISLIALPYGAYIQSSWNPDGTHVVDSLATFTGYYIVNDFKYLDSKFIKDMYYDNGKTITELVPLQTVSGFMLMEDPLYCANEPFVLSLNVGATYIVNWDGIEYELVCQMLSGMNYIGNPNYVIMQSGGDIPFTILESGGMVFVPTESTAESHEIGIIEIKHDMKQLDIKYLPILEEEYEVVFEIEGFTGVEILDESYKKLVGEYKVTVDGKSEIAEFFDDFDGSYYYSDNFEIDTWNGGISFWFSEDGEHSIKIEEIKKVIKEEHLPKSISAAPDWNQNDETAPDYIENRTHYTEEKIIVLSEKLELFDENGDSNGFVMTNYEWDQNKEYIVLCNGTKYPVTWDRFYYAGSYCYYLGARPNNLTHDLPFSLSGYNMSEIDARPLDIATYDSIEKYDIKVVNVEDDIHYLDSKYIKDMYYSSNKYIGTLSFIATSSNTMEYTYTEADVDIFNSFMTSRDNGEIIEVNIDNEACLMSVAFDRGWFNFAGGISGEMNYNDGQVWSATINATNIVLTTGNTYKIKFYNTQEEEIKYIDPKYIKDMYYDEIIDTKSATVECTSESTVAGSFKDAHYYKEIYYFFRPFLYDYSGKLRITWNGKVYHFDFDKNETVYIGDTNFEEYPFAIDWGREWGVVHVPTSGTYNFEITKVNFKQLDEKFIPDTIARVGTPQPYFVLTDTVTGAPYKIEITNGNLVSSPLEEV